MPVLKLAADHHGRNIPLFEISEQIDIDEEPVRDYDERFDGTREQHLEIPFESPALVVSVGKNGQIRSLIERILDAPQNQRAERIGDIEHHHADGMVALGAKKPGDQLGSVSKLFGGPLDAVFGGSRNIARERRIIQDDRNSRCGNLAFLRHISQA